jgi:hypothetical protein
MPDRTIDAVRVPVGYARGRGVADRYRAIDAEFRPLLGGGRLWLRNQGAFVFVTPGAADTLLFPKDHPRSGEDRYSWQDRGDGVSFGVLVPDDRADAGPGADEVKRMTAEAIGKLRAAGATGPGPGQAEATHAAG